MSRGPIQSKHCVGQVLQDHTLKMLVCAAPGPFTACSIFLFPHSIMFSQWKIKSFCCSEATFLVPSKIINLFCNNVQSTFIFTVCVCVWCCVVCVCVCVLCVCVCVCVVCVCVWVCVGVCVCVCVYCVYVCVVSHFLSLARLKHSQTNGCVFAEVCSLSGNTPPPQNSDKGRQ